MTGNVYMQCILMYACCHNYNIQYIRPKTKIVSDNTWRKLETSVRSLGSKCLPEVTLEHTMTQRELYL